MHFYGYFSRYRYIVPRYSEKIQKMYLDTYLADTRYHTPILCPQQYGMLEPKSIHSKDNQGIKKLFWHQADGKWMQA